MKNLTALSLLLGTLGGVILVHRSTDGICTYNELAFMPDCRDMKPFEALGFFTGSVEDDMYLLQLTYLRNASFFVTKNVTVSLEVQDSLDNEKGKIYYVSAIEGSRGGSYKAISLEKYDELVLNFKGFYDVCWDYDCTGEIPWQKMKEKKRFFLGIVGGEYTTGVYPAVDVPAKGNINILTLFLYDGKPVSDEKRAGLERAIEYVEEWYNSRAKTITGDEVLDMRIKFYERQIPIQGDYNPCSADAVKSITSEVPETEDYDVLVLVHVLENPPRCPPYPSGNVISLYIKADQLDTESDVDTLVRSFAHEIAHVFGATDKYTGVREWEAGIKVGCKFEPEMLGRDIMCHRVPEGAGESFGYINPPLEGLYIKWPTARELGWYDGDGDGVMEVIDPCPMDGRNICA